MLGIETCSFLPDDQRDRGNLPRQGEASHRWSHPLGKQSLVKIVKRPAETLAVVAAPLKIFFRSWL